MVTVYRYVSLSVITSSLLEGEEFKLGTFKLVIDPGTNCFYMIMCVGKGTCWVLSNQWMNITVVGN